MHNPITTPRHRGMIEAAAFTAAEINHKNMDGFKITPHEAQIMLSVLTKHDGSTLTPELDRQDRANVSNLFDKLRFNLREMAEKEAQS